MTLSMQFPINVVLPSSLIGQINGKVDISLLDTVEPTKTSLVYLMEKHAARSMRALHAKALAAGIILTTTGRGRTYDQQLSLFLERYQTVPIAGQSTKIFEGKTWWLKKGMAMAATPGTSNHGLWLADDLAEMVNGQLVGLRASTVQWLYANAPSFGFYWESSTETWHVRYVTGDAVPQATLDYEASLNPVPPTIPPTPPTIPEDDEMSIAIYQCLDAAASFIAYTVKSPIGHTVALTISWIQTTERLAAFKAEGFPVFQINSVDLKTCDLIGPVPHGDYLPWTKANFASVSIQA